MKTQFKTRKDGQHFPVKITRKTAKRGTTKSSGKLLHGKSAKHKHGKSIDVGDWEGQHRKNDLHHLWKHQWSDDIVEITPFNEERGKSSVSNPSISDEHGNMEEEIIFIGTYDEAVIKAHQWMVDNPKGWKETLDIDKELQDKEDLEFQSYLNEDDD